MSWTFHHIPSTNSTNDAARNLPPWTALRATEQTLGRGRLGRHWFSRPGGLWASFVLPLDDPSFPWTPLPLVAGLALIDLTRSFGVTTSRLRWPNDLLVESSKLAGILVERPSPDHAIVGIGLNVSNLIADVADQLHDPPVRLADIASGPVPELDEIFARLAIQLESRFRTFRSLGLVGLADDLNAAWGKPRPVIVEFDGKEACGTFIGVDNAGNPILEFPDSSRKAMPGVHISRLREA